MLMLIVALAASPQPAWWADFQRTYKRCRMVFNVDGPGPAGDGLVFSDDFKAVDLSTDRRRPQKPIRCIARWAKMTGLTVHYRLF